jgi:hypothetical protein
VGEAQRSGPGRAGRIGMVNGKKRLQKKSSITQYTIIAKAKKESKSEKIT